MNLTSQPFDVLRLRHVLRTVLLPLLLWATANSAAHAAEATPSDVYAQTVRIQAEVDSIKRHFKITGKAHAEPKIADLKPRHAWAGNYIILLKLGKLRRKQGLPYVAPVNIEPLLDMTPNHPWAMTQRILNEIAITKRLLDIPGQPPATVPVSGKHPLDVYNSLHQISGDLDLLMGTSTPSEAYSEAKRLDDDVSAILRHQNIFDNAAPPQRRDNLQPKDSLQAVFMLLAEVQRLQRAHGLVSTDFKGFQMGDKTTPDDVIGLIELALAELQYLKAKLGMTHAITATGSYEENKAPADVVQLIGYITAKLRAIESK
jgi:hypothetical protein